MVEELAKKLQEMQDAAHQLRSKTDWNFAQEQFISALATEINSLLSLIFVVPDDMLAGARQLVSFETRSHLASIIGYAEMLLDEDDGPLSDEQKNLTDQIANGGKSMLSSLITLEQDDN
jgi:signal transduction histidine kinase